MRTLSAFGEDLVRRRQKGRSPGLSRFIYRCVGSAGLVLFAVVAVAKAQDPVVVPAAVEPATSEATPSSTFIPFDFKKVPPVRPFYRQGMFPISPTGPGYYSLLSALRGTSTEGPPKFGYPPF